MDNFIQTLNSTLPHHQKKNGCVVKSAINNTVVAVNCPDNVVVGKNVNDLLSVGTSTEVVNSQAEITNEVADAFITQGWAEEVL